VDACEASHNFLFGPSTVIVSRIREMASLHYIIDGDARTPGQEVILEPIDDKVVVFEKFFAVVLRMPPRPKPIFCLSFWYNFTN
jgi:hypothetical protein